MPSLKPIWSALKGWTGLLLIALLASGCSSTSGNLADAANDDVVLVHDSQVVPATTMTDLVTYGDVASVFEVVSEKELPLTREELERGEGVIVRQVRAKQVSGVPAWKRASNGGSATPPTEWNIADGGGSSMGASAVEW